MTTAKIHCHFTSDPEEAEHVFEFPSLEAMVLEFDNLIMNPDTKHLFINVIGADESFFNLDIVLQPNQTPDKRLSYVTVGCNIKADNANYQLVRLSKTFLEYVYINMTAFNILEAPVASEAIN